MTARRFGRILGLALCLWGVAAQAQRVVVLEIQDDRGGRVRSQVERALVAAGKVEVVPLERYRKAAERQQLRGPRAMTPSAVAQVAPQLELDAAVTGSVGVTFLVQILDPQGQELWSKAIPLTRGGISSDNARKLAAAIAVAARARPPPDPEPTPPPPDESSGTPPVEPVDTPPPEVTTGEPAPSPPAPPGSGPRLLAVSLGGTTTWRMYCARPGVSSCGAFEKLGEKPPGEMANFGTLFPYLGLDLSAELFPLASMDSLARGLGLLASYARASSLSVVRVTTPSSETQPKTVVSTDHLVQAMAVYRYYFPFGFGRLAGHVGARGGLLYRGFDVDPKAEVPVPGARRLHGLLGLELTLPVIRLARLEAAAMYFPDARPGPHERESYGNPATGSGLAGELGVAGEVTGPFGYSLKARYHTYADLFRGAGAAWSNGGAAEEWYGTVVCSVTAHF